jgi:hypothetical protein
VSQCTTRYVNLLSKVDTVINPKSSYTFVGSFFSYGADTELSDFVTVLRIQSVEAVVVVVLGRNITLQYRRENFN